MHKTPERYFYRPKIQLSIDAEGKPITFRQLISVVVVFCAAAHIDGSFVEIELKEIIKLLASEFDASPEYAKQLHEIAEFLLMDQKNINRYVEVINAAYNDMQKQRVLDLISHVIGVDGRLVQEEVILRKHLQRLFKLE